MKFGIFSSDKTGYRVGNNEFVLLELTGYGILTGCVILRPQGKVGVGGGGFPYKNDRGVRHTFMYELRMRFWHL